MTHPTDQIESYLAGGFSPEERSAFESHIAECAACAALLDEARGVDAEMNDLFAEVRPSPDFEDRIVQSLVLPQLPHPRPIRHPMFSRWLGGIAALLVVGIIGLIATSIFGHKTSAMIGTLAAVLPGNETKDSGPLTSGSLIETTNDSGTIEINANPAADTANTDRLDFNTGLQSAEIGTTSSLALDIDGTDDAASAPRSADVHAGTIHSAEPPAIAILPATPKSNPAVGVANNTAPADPKTPAVGVANKTATAERNTSTVGVANPQTPGGYSTYVIVGLCVVASLGLLIWAGRRLLKWGQVTR